MNIWTYARVAAGATNEDELVAAIEAVNRAAQKSFDYFCDKVTLMDNASLLDGTPEGPFDLTAQVERFWELALEKAQGLREPEAYMLRYLSGALAPLLHTTPDRLPLPGIRVTKP